MTKLKTEEKLDKIELQIKKLKEQKKKMETKVKLNVGNALLSEWEITEETVAMEVIRQLKNDAKLIVQELTNSTQSTLDNSSTENE
ncbi:hypothetical protein KM915_20895 [Cytobacillus oceanisediminis]|uniref:hypothetical protein n=1 Tax=Cytobacillus oceanisediminis TaxID=665099 RepID=UPI001C21E5D5|nr:hypothetical protein [Cytobacillus oceanisediminis]MBU8732509.1 hypothetical protein [Cytobacillus oceanisediminis]